MTEETASNETSAACKAASTNDVIDVAAVSYTHLSSALP